MPRKRSTAVDQKTKQKKEYEKAIESYQKYLKDVFIGKDVRKLLTHCIEDAKAVFVFRLLLVERIMAFMIALLIAGTKEERLGMVPKVDDPARTFFHFVTGAPAPEGSFISDSIPSRDKLLNSLSAPMKEKVDGTITALQKSITDFFIHFLEWIPHKDYVPKWSIVGACDIITMSILNESLGLSMMEFNPLTTKVEFSSNATPWQNLFVQVGPFRQKIINLVGNNVSKWDQPKFGLVPIENVEQNHKKQMENEILRKDNPTTQQKPSLVAMTPVIATCNILYDTLDIITTRVFMESRVLPTFDSRAANTVEFTKQWDTELKALKAEFSNTEDLVHSMKKYSNYVTGLKHLNFFCMSALRAFCSENLSVIFDTNTLWMDFNNTLRGGSTLSYFLSSFTNEIDPNPLDSLERFFDSAIPNTPLLQGIKSHNGPNSLPSIMTAAGYVYPSIFTFGRSLGFRGDLLRHLENIQKEMGSKLQNVLELHTVVMNTVRRGVLNSPEVTGSSEFQLFLRQRLLYVNLTQSDTLTGTEPFTQISASLVPTGTAIPTQDACIEKVITSKFPSLGKKLSSALQMRNSTFEDGMGAMMNLYLVMMGEMISPTPSLTNVVVDVDAVIRELSVKELSSYIWGSSSSSSSMSSSSISLPPDSIPLLMYLLIRDQVAQDPSGFPAASLYGPTQYAANHERISHSLMMASYNRPTRMLGNRGIRQITSYSKMTAILPTLIGVMDIAMKYTSRELHTKVKGDSPSFYLHYYSNVLHNQFSVELGTRTLDEFMNNISDVWLLGEKTAGVMDPVSFVGISSSIKPSFAQVPEVVVPSVPKQWQEKNDISSRVESQTKKELQMIVTRDHGKARIEKPGLTPKAAAAFAYYGILVPQIDCFAIDNEHGLPILRALIQIFLDSALETKISANLLDIEDRLVVPNNLVHTLTDTFTRILHGQENVYPLTQSKAVDAPIPIAPNNNDFFFGGSVLFRYLNFKYDFEAGGLDNRAPIVKNFFGPPRPGFDFLFGPMSDSLFLHMKPAPAVITNDGKRFTNTDDLKQLGSAMGLKKFDELSGQVRGVAGPNGIHDPAQLIEPWADFLITWCGLSKEDDIYFDHYEKVMNLFANYHVPSKKRMINLLVAYYYSMEETAVQADLHIVPRFPFDLGIQAKKETSELRNTIINDKANSGLGFFGRIAEVFADIAIVAKNSENDFPQPNYKLDENSLFGKISGDKKLNDMGGDKLQYQDFFRHAFWFILRYFSPYGWSETEAYDMWSLVLYAAAVMKKGKAEKYDSTIIAKLACSPLDRMSFVSLNAKLTAATGWQKDALDNDFSTMVDKTSFSQIINTRFDCFFKMQVIVADLKYVFVTLLADTSFNDLTIRKKCTAPILNTLFGGICNTYFRNVHLNVFAFLLRCPIELFSGEHEKIDETVFSSTLRSELDNLHDDGDGLEVEVNYLIKAMPTFVFFAKLLRAVSYELTANYIVLNSTASDENKGDLLITKISTELKELFGEKAKSVSAVPCTPGTNSSKEHKIDVNLTKPQGKLVLELVFPTAQVIDTVWVVGHVVHGFVLRVFCFIQYYTNSTPNIKVQTIVGPFLIETGGAARFHVSDECIYPIHIDSGFDTNAAEKVLKGSPHPFPSSREIRRRFWVGSETDGQKVTPRFDTIIPYLMIAREEFKTKKEVLFTTQDDYIKQNDFSEHDCLIGIVKHPNDETPMIAFMYVHMANGQLFVLFLESGETMYVDINVAFDVDIAAGISPVVLPFYFYLGNFKRQPGMRFDLTVFKWTHKYLMFPFNQIMSTRGPWESLAAEDIINVNKCANFSVPLPTITATSISRENTKGFFDFCITEGGKYSEPEGRSGLVRLIAENMSVSPDSLANYTPDESVLVQRLTGYVKPSFDPSELADGGDILYFFDKYTRHKEELVRYREVALDTGLNSIFHNGIKTRLAILHKKRESDLETKEKIKKEEEGEEEEGEKEEGEEEEDEDEEEEEEGEEEEDEDEEGEEEEGEEEEEEEEGEEEEDEDEEGEEDEDEEEEEEGEEEEDEDEEGEEEGKGKEGGEGEEEEEEEEKAEASGGKTFLIDGHTTYDDLFKRELMDRPGSLGISFIISHSRAVGYAFPRLVLLFDSPTITVDDVRYYFQPIYDYFAPNVFWVDANNLLFKKNKTSPKPEDGGFGNLQTKLQELDAAGDRKNYFELECSHTWDGKKVENKGVSSVGQFLMRFQSKTIVRMTHQSWENLMLVELACWKTYGENPDVLLLTKIRGHVEMFAELKRKGVIIKVAKP